MPLTPEDALRIEVLLRTAHAIRLEHNPLSLRGLGEQKELIVQLHVNNNEQAYLREVQEVLAASALGDVGDGGRLPASLGRWGRLGQLNSKRLSAYLMLADPEAVVAVACSPNLTPELAERAWWASESPDVARNLLCSSAIREAELGQRLADFLLEHIAFEENMETLLQSIVCILDTHTDNQESQKTLWKKASQKPIIYAAFLQTMPDRLNEFQTCSNNEFFASALARIQDVLPDNSLARRLRFVLSETGRAFLTTCQAALKKPSNALLVETVVEALTKYINADNCGDSIVQPKDEKEFIDFLHCNPDFESYGQGLLNILAVDPVEIERLIGNSPGMGVALRRQLKSVLRPIQTSLSLLLTPV